MYRERIGCWCTVFIDRPGIRDRHITRAGVEHFSPCLYGSRHIKGKDLVAFSRRGKGQGVSTVVNFRAAKRHHHWIGLAHRNANESGAGCLLHKIRDCAAVTHPADTDHRNAILLGGFDGMFHTHFRRDLSGGIVGM